MDTLMNVSQSQIGLIIWILWALIGVFEGLLTARVFNGRYLAADIVAGIVGGVAGGYFSIDFVGDGPVQRFLVSVLGAVFGAALLIWVAGLFFRRR